MLECRICGIGLAIGIINAICAWCSHAWYFEVLAIIGILIAVFGYAYMNKE